MAALKLRGGFSDVEKGMATVAALVFSYLRARRQAGEIGAETASAIGATLWSLADSVGHDAKPSRLTEKAVVRWLGSRDVAPSTKRRNLSEVRMFCRWLVRHGYLRSDPTVDIRGPRQPRPADRRLQAEWVALMLDSCADSRDRCVVSLMVQLGLRCIEVTRLQLGDVDFGAGTIHVVGKGSHERTLPLTAEAKAAVLAYLADHPAKAGPLIRSYLDPYAGISPRYLSHRVAAISARAGVHRCAHDGRTAHALRHTAASDTVDAGADLRDVQTMLGHASLATTGRYAGRTSLPRLRQVMEGRRYAPMNFETRSVGARPQVGRPARELPGD